jgi:hypothetical protein
MTVFNVEREEHAARIARKEIGQRLENIPLDVLEIEELDEDDEDDEEELEADDGDGDDAVTEAIEDIEAESESTQSGDDDVLPEFEELIDE